MDLISYKEALEKGLTKYYTGWVCKRGHTAEQYVKGNACVTCALERGKRLSSSVEAKKKKREYDMAYRQTIPEHKKALKRLKASTYKKENKAQVVADTKWRRFTVRKSTPKWANRKAIKVFYEEAARLTAETGVRYSVDHIIPIRGKTVCGFHVETNLRVIPLLENMRKLNKLDEQILIEAGLY